MKTLEFLSRPIIVLSHPSHKIIIIWKSSSHWSEHAPHSSPNKHPGQICSFHRLSRHSWSFGVWWTGGNLCVCCSEASTVGPSGPLRAAEQRRQVTFTSVGWVLLVCSVCTIFLHGGANTTPLDIRWSVCMGVCARVWVCVAEGAGQVEESQSVLRKLYVFL